MKKTTTILCTLIFLGLALPAFADDVDTTEYNFDDTLVEGDLLVPQGAVVNIQKTRPAKSLIIVRKHFIPEMLKSVEQI